MRGKYRLGGRPDLLQPGPRQDQAGQQAGQRRGQPAPPGQPGLQDSANIKDRSAILSYD